MLPHARARFWVELASAATAVGSALLTMVWRDWIEVVLRVDPDQHSGSLEWSFVAVLALAGLALSLLARREWVVTTRRHARTDAVSATS